MSWNGEEVMAECKTRLKVQMLWPCNVEVKLVFHLDLLIIEIKKKNLLGL